MTNTFSGQVSSLTVLGHVILCLNQCEQRIESAGRVPKLPSSVLAQPPAPRQRGDTYGSPVCVFVCVCLCMCVLLTQPHSLSLSLSLTHTHTHTHTHAYNSSHTLSCTDSAGIISKTSRENFTQAGQNITQSVHPRGLQLDPKYLSEYPGVLITSDC